jgi:segregation and condensation protein A
LVEYKQFKEAADQLWEREKIWQNVFWKEPTPVASEPEAFPPLEVNLFDLLDAFKEILERAPENHSMAITMEELSVKDKMNLILEEIEKENSIAFRMLFQKDHTRMEIVVTFLALLELVRLGLIKAMQVESFGPIRLFQGEGHKNGG